MAKVVVFQKGEKRGHVWEGNYEAGVTPSNALLISELLPDLANANNGNPIKVIRSIYNDTAWKQVVIDGEDTDTE